MRMQFDLAMITGVVQLLWKSTKDCHFKVKKNVLGMGTYL